MLAKTKQAKKQSKVKMIEDEEFHFPSFFFFFILGKNLCGSAVGLFPPKLLFSSGFHSFDNKTAAIIYLNSAMCVLHPSQKPS